MQEAILDREALQPPVVQLPAQVQYARAIFRMDLLHPERQNLQALFPVSGNAADLAQSVVDVNGAPIEVHLVERQPGEFDRRMA
jgi:hypothetical protein